MTRKLVTIREVKDILPIDGADAIELAIIDGWQVVVMKGRHRPGELVLFYEIDSFLPSTDPRYASFEERFINWGDKRGMRLKSIKLRKQLSQGLVMPLADFPEVHPELHRVGEDVTDLLGIEKWEPIEKPTPGRNPGATGEKRFPAFIPKTDQERVQNCGALVERALDEDFEVTMKKDGSSMTVFCVDPSSRFYKDAKNLTRKKLGFVARMVEWLFDWWEGPAPIYGICSRNVLLDADGDTNFHRAVLKYELFAALAAMGPVSMALQGEVVAPDIQENHEKVKEVEFHLFDMFDIEQQTYLPPSERRMLADVFSIPHVTVLESGQLREVLGWGGSVTDVVKLCLEYAEGPGDNPGVMREGVVFKSESRDFSFKAISNSYLLKKG